MEDGPALAILVHNLPDIQHVLKDLGVLVVHAPTDSRFIASDNPVVKFNHYLAGTFDVGVLGADCRGLEVALPISPEAAIILFDRDAYQARDSGSERAQASVEDVLRLNRLQAFGARENVYFSQWEDAESVAAIVAGIGDRQRIHVARAREEGGENHELVAVSDVLPDLPMDISCLPVRRGAARMPHAERIHKFRHMPADRRVSVPPELQRIARFPVVEKRYIQVKPIPGSRGPGNPAGPPAAPEPQPAADVGGGPTK